MVAADEPAVVEPNRLFRIERRCLSGLAVGNAVGADVIPRVDLGPPPPAELAAGVGLDGVTGVAGECRDD